MDLDFDIPKKVSAEMLNKSRDKIMALKKISNELSRYNFKCQSKLLQIESEVRKKKYEKINEKSFVMVSDFNEIIDKTISQLTELKIK